jgi:hypothetical protein
LGRLGGQKPVLLQRYDRRLQRILIRQRGEAVRDGSRAHLLVLLEAYRAPANPGSPGSWLDTRMRPKLLAIKVSGFHLVPMIFASQ